MFFSFSFFQNLWFLSDETKELAMYNKRLEPLKLNPCFPRKIETDKLGLKNKLWLRKENVEKNKITFYKAYIYEIFTTMSIKEYIIACLTLYLASLRFQWKVGQISKYSP